MSDLIGLVSEYTTAGSSSLISVGKHADGSWKICDTLMSFTPFLLEKKIYK